MNEIRRIDYQSGPLLEQDLATTPLRQFERWLHEANTAGIEEPNAMTVATVDRDGQPHVRTILCKEVVAEGFVFFTNYDSDKGRQLDDNPRIALCFHWQPMHRQVRVTGRAERLPEAQSDAYFGSRPRDAQLGAWSSAQSQVISDRDELRARWEQALQRFDAAEPETLPQLDVVTLIDAYSRAYDGLAALARQRRALAQAWLAGPADEAATPPVGAPEADGDG